MFTDLAFIDWIALAFASVLLAGAAAAAVLAYVTSRARTSEPKSGYAHASSKGAVRSTPSVARATEPPTGQHARGEKIIVDMRDHRPKHASGPQHAAEPGHAASPVEACQADAEAEYIPVRQAMPMPEVRSANGNEYTPAHTAVATVERTEHAVAESEHSSDIASRAARLRGRPIAESPSTTSQATKASPTAAAAPPERPKSSDLDSQPSRIGFATRGPGFFEDPMGRHELRYWDGARWTEYVKERGERFTDPL